MADGCHRGVRDIRRSGADTKSCRLWVVTVVIMGDYAGI